MFIICRVLKSVINGGAVTFDSSFLPNPSGIAHTSPTEITIFVSGIYQIIYLVSVNEVNTFGLYYEQNSSFLAGSTYSSVTTNQQTTGTVMTTFISTAVPVTLQLINRTGSTVNLSSVPNGSCNASISIVKLANSPI